jgi:hypothetical protein
VWLVFWLHIAPNPDKHAEATRILGHLLNSYSTGTSARSSGRAQGETHTSVDALDGTIPSRRLGEVDHTKTVTFDGYRRH